MDRFLKLPADNSAVQPSKNPVNVAVNNPKVVKWAKKNSIAVPFR